LRHLDFGLSFAADARNGPFSLLTDFMHFKFSPTTSQVNIKSIDLFGQPSLPISRSLQNESPSAALRNSAHLVARHPALDFSVG